MIRYAIVDSSYRIGDAGRLATDGVDYIQLRVKTATASELLDLSRTILGELSMIQNASTQLLINSRADIALAAGAAAGQIAHGVHLTSSPTELTPQQIRTLYAALPLPSSLFPPGVPGGRSLPAGVALPCISVSCHTLADVTRAHTHGADLILFGPVFEKRVARQFIHDGSGLTALAAAVRAANGTPVLALGGITEENTAACLAAGAAGIAAIRLFR